MKDPAPSDYLHGEAVMLDLTRLIPQPEGQYLDRKSLWHGPPERRRVRDRREVRNEIAEYVAAFANADGGVLMLGVEDDGTVTGHGYLEDAVEVMLRTPRPRPPVAGCRSRATNCSSSRSPRPSGR